jgi:hypothetical protein
LLILTYIDWVSKAFEFWSTPCWTFLNPSGPHSWSVSFLCPCSTPHEALCKAGFRVEFLAIVTGQVVPNEEEQQWRLTNPQEQCWWVQFDILHPSKLFKFRILYKSYIVITCYYNIVVCLFSFSAQCNLAEGSAPRSHLCRRRSACLPPPMVTGNGLLLGLALSMSWRGELRDKTLRCSANSDKVSIMPWHPDRLYTHNIYQQYLLYSAIVVRFHFLLYAILRYFLQFRHGAPCLNIENADDTEKCSARSLSKSRCIWVTNGHGPNLESKSNDPNHTRRINCIYI